MKHLLFIDFESYYNPADGYGLRQQSMVEYVRDSRFKAFGMGAAEIDSEIRWYSAEDIGRFLGSYGYQAGGWENVAVVGHNIKFDGLILKEHFSVVPGQYIDTKGMSRAVLGKSIKGHSLANLADYFQLPSKGVMKTEGLSILTTEQETELAEYCQHDVWLCREIYLRLANGFPANQYGVLHRTVDMFINPKTVLNVPLLAKTSREEAARRSKIFELIGIDKKEFSSNIRFPKLLESKGFEVPMKYSPKKKDKEGKPLRIPALALGDIEFLEMVESENEELRALCEARVAAKSTLLETRSGKLASIGGTGAWPFDVEFSGADQTHRFSGGKGAGGNPQNFTRGSALRTAVEAPSGYKLVVGDYANIELRIVAYLSRDPGLVQAIEHGTDIYCDFASVFYGRRITKADKKERQFGKTAILGLGYGMGWKKFKHTVRLQTKETISEENARKAIELYRTRYAGVSALWAILHDKIQSMTTKDSSTVLGLPVTFEHECIMLPSGLKIRYPNLRQERTTSKDEETGRAYTRIEWVYDVYDKGHLAKRKLYGGKVLENISQALAGELCKESMMQMDNVTGLVHDEIHVIAKKGLGLIVAQKLKRVMSVPPSWFPNIKLDAEVGVGENWGETK